MRPATLAALAALLLAIFAAAAFQLFVMTDRGEDDPGRDQPVTTTTVPAVTTTTALG